jgi:hypothetical protein
MPVNLALLSHAAPLLVEAANAVFNKIKKSKDEGKLKDQVVDMDARIRELEKGLNEIYSINEDQSLVIKNLAEQNQKLILALRNTRILAFMGVLLAIISLVLVYLK